MQETPIPSTKLEIEQFSQAECETALNKLKELFGITQDPNLLVKYKLCQTRIQSRLLHLKAVRMQPSGLF